MLSVSIPIDFIFSIAFLSFKGKDNNNSSCSLISFFFLLASPLAIPPLVAISLCSSFVLSLCGIKLLFIFFHLLFNIVFPILRTFQIHPMSLYILLHSLLYLCKIFLYSLFLLCHLQ